MNELNLLQRFVAALNGLHLVSQGTTQSFDARTTGTKEHHGPAGDGSPEYDRLLKQMNDHGLTIRLVEEAEETLANWKRQPEPKDREFERNSLAWKRRVANDDRDLDEICRIYTLKRKEVRGLQRWYREDSDR